MIKTDDKKECDYCIKLKNLNTCNCCGSNVCSECGTLCKECGTFICYGCSSFTSDRLVICEICAKAK